MAETPKLYHGGAPRLTVGARLHLPACVTPSLGIAAFYAATYPNGWVYEVESRGELYHDDDFDQPIQCFRAHEEAVVRRVVGPMALSDVELLAPSRSGRPAGTEGAAVVEGMWRCSHGHYNLASPDVCAYCDEPREPKEGDRCANCGQPYENHGRFDAEGATCPDRSGCGFEFQEATAGTPSAETPTLVSYRVIPSMLQNEDVRMLHELANVLLVHQPNPHDPHRYPDFLRGLAERLAASREDRDRLSEFQRAIDEMGSMHRGLDEFATDVCRLNAAYKLHHPMGHILNEAREMEAKRNAGSDA